MTTPPPDTYCVACSRPIWFCKPGFVADGDEAWHSEECFWEWYRSKERKKEIEYAIENETEKENQTKRT